MTRLPSRAGRRVRTGPPKTLERVLSKAGIGSRVDARGWIHDGRVKVNGRVVRDPDHWVDMQADRVRYYRRLHQVLADDQPLVFLYWRDSLPVVSSRIHGILPGPAGISWNFTDWFVPKELQRYTSG